MLYRCWYCAWDINPRGRISNEKIGTYILYDHKTFCSEECVVLFQKLKTKPKYCPKSQDWYDISWRKERKINRLPRLKSKDRNKINKDVKQ